MAQSIEQFSSFFISPYNPSQAQAEKACCRSDGWKRGGILGLAITLLSLSLIYISLSPKMLWAATINAASCSQADVNSAVTSAVAGDTVVIPSCPSGVAWTSGISISGITLKGGGSGRIIAWSEPAQTIGTGTKTMPVQASGLPITAGQWLRVSRTGTRGSYMEGTVTNYSGTTLVMNITTTAGSGSSTRWLISTVPTTVLIHNVAAGNPVVTLTEHTSQRTQFQDIKIVAGTGTGVAMGLTRTSGGKAQLVHDCWLENAGIRSSTNRGVIYNCSFDSSPFSMALTAVAIYDPNNTTNSWASASTMGSADTTGENNLYIEDCDFHAWLNAFDNADNGRIVVRHSTFNEAGFGTHGADTGIYGQQHFEVYNSTFIRRIYSDGSSFPLPRWFYIRGGTYAIHSNSFLIAPHGNDYGDPGLDMTVMNLRRNVGGPNSCWGANISGIQYPAPRQVGFGRVTEAAGNDGFGVYFGDTEPAYIWNNTGDAIRIDLSDYGGVECTNPDSTTKYVVLNRDYFNNTAKPDYTPYSYPHPLVTSLGTTSSFSLPRSFPQGQPLNLPPRPQGLTIK